MLPEILRNALPEALGGLIATGIGALVVYLFTRLRNRGNSTVEKKKQPLQRLLLWIIGGIVLLIPIIYLIINNSPSS
ncbi:MAG: hypothetical protein AB1649_29750, partial [Chloroflexota bacterium]